jgi:hypothetical protein
MEDFVGKWEMGRWILIFILIVGISMSGFISMGIIVHLALIYWLVVFVTVPHCPSEECKV